MAIRLECSCGQNLKAPNTYRGAQAECPYCGRMVVIPDSSSPSLEKQTAADAEPTQVQRRTAVDKPTTSPNAGIVFCEPLEVKEFFEPPKGAIVANKKTRTAWFQRMMAAMLDPRSIQWMLTLGGGLMVLGLIVWIVSLGIFENPRVLAAFLIAGSFGLLTLGCVVVMRTKYRIAGQALTFLSCVLVPLNLWFLHSHNLVSVTGNLWIGGLVCCVLYAAVVYVLRDPLFLYAVEGGITLTVVLFLANLGLAGDTTYLSLFLMGLGVVSIHAERIFPAAGETFTRQRFGLPLFWSGQAQLGASLLILLGTQVVAWSLPATKQFLSFSLDGNWLVETAWLSGSMWLVATYTYLYSDFIVRRIGVYVYLAAASMLLAVVSFIGLSVSAEGVIIVLAGSSLIVNLGQRQLRSAEERIARALPPLAHMLSVPPVLLGLLLHVRATSQFVNQSWQYETGWVFVAAMLAVAICHRVSAHLFHRDDVRQAWNYMFLSAAAVVVGAAGLLRVADLNEWPSQACLLMLIPIAYLVAARLWRGRFPERPLGAIAHTASVVILLHAFLGTLESIDRFFVERSTDNLLLGFVFAEATAFYVLAAIFRRKSQNVYFASVAACGAVWQFMCYRGIDGSYYSLFYAVLGVLLLITARRLGLSWSDRYQLNSDLIKRLTGPGLSAYQSGNAILGLAILISGLQGIGRILADDLAWQPLAATILTTLISLSAVWIVPGGSWRRFYACGTVGLAAIVAVTFHRSLNFTMLQTVEVVFVTAGILVLAASYVGRFLEEREGENDAVSMGLLLGSALAGLTLLAVVLYHRFITDDGPSLANELALLTVSILMLVTGYAWQFKAPTLIGGFSGAVYLFVLVASLAYRPQIAVGVYLAIGGGVLFVIGLVLSVYRDRLLELPEQIARREGVFRIINWR